MDVHFREAPIEANLPMLMGLIGIWYDDFFGAETVVVLPYDHYLGRLPWIDALLNATMILTGMGPVDPMRSTPGKLFSMFYALFSGIAFLTIMAVLLAPVIHRALHKFHLPDSDDGGQADGT